MILKKYFSLVSWDDLFCHPKCEGSLGIRTNVDINSAIIIRRGGKIFNC